MVEIESSKFLSLYIYRYDKYDLACFYCYAVIFLLASINQFSIPTFRISLLVLNSKLGQLKSELLTEANKLEAKIDFFNSR